MLNNNIANILPIRVPKCHTSFNSSAFQFICSEDIVLYMYETQAQLTDAIEAVNENTEKNNIHIMQNRNNF